MKRVCGFTVSQTVMHYYTVSRNVAWSLALPRVGPMNHVLHEDQTPTLEGAIFEGETGKPL